ncbi:MAG: hypothetical protein ABW000_23365 [Actinoplanes sp.]
MTAHIEIDFSDGIEHADEPGGSLNARLVGSGSAQFVEIRLSANDSTNTIRLTKTETDVFSLSLARLAGDPSDLVEPVVDPEAVADRLTQEGRAITRDELIRMLLDLPRESEIDVQIGTEHVAVTGVVPWGRNWAALQCHRPDFLELLEAWRLPADIQEQIANGTR